MDLLTPLRLMAEVGVLLAICWPLAMLPRALASRGKGCSAHTWLLMAKGLVVASLALPLAGRVLVRERASGWAPVQVWSVPASAGEAAHRVTAAAGPDRRSSTQSSLSQSMERWLALIAAIATLGAAYRLARLTTTLRRLRRHMESLPLLRMIGAVCVVASDEAPVAYSARAGGKAWIVLPGAVLADRASLRFSIAHELQHHRHRDASGAIALEATAAIFWWNPFLPLLRRTLSALEELACDEAVIARRSIDRAAYAGCLLEAAGRLAQGAALPAPVAAMAAHSRGLLKRRIEMICRSQVRRRTSIALAAAAGVFGILIAGSLVARAAVADLRISRAEAEALAAAQAGPIPIKIDDHVLAELNRLAGTPERRAFIREALVRMQEYRPPIEQALSEKGLPLELLAVPLIESGFRNMDESSKLPSLAPGMRGAGIWMFIPDTARHYGLRVDSTNDERLDPALETRAAVTMLAELHQRYGDWPLALAAYNQGNGAVDAAIAAGKVRDAAALTKMGRLNNYTSTVLAGMLVLQNPKLVE